jgi:hypothetical protein
MQLLYSRHSWFYSQDFNKAIDFCIWTLEVDGLHVPPFDSHPEGDGSLRALGLTAKDWQDWLLFMIHQQNEQSRLLRQQAAPGKELFSRFPSGIHHPPSAWNKGTALRNKLDELWEQYGSISHQRRKREFELARVLRKEERTSNKRLYDELKPYHNRIPPLAIYEVAYEHPLDYIMAPATLVMTVQEGQPEAREFHERVLAAVAELAAYPARRGSQVLYTRGGDSSGRFPFAYCRHTRKPTPPAPPRPAMPKLDDAARQVVLEDLANDPFPLQIPDLTTLQFLREKNRPGWRLYEITFQEIDGEQHRQIVLLQQDEDGSWHSRSRGSSSDMQNQWHKIVAPVRDHPLLFLAYQGGTNHATMRYSLLAHGDVIDNGFHVERVRLVNNAGLALEDTVEDGWVFFACEQKEEIQLPMQAELYNKDGKLVWCQTVPHDGLPPWHKILRPKRMPQ